MPIISRFLGIVIQMFFKDHNPPHFHVRYNSYKASIGISDLEIIDGYLPKKVYSLVIEWAMLHKTELMLDWNKLKNLEAPTKIKPLV